MFVSLHLVFVHGGEDAAIDRVVAALRDAGASLPQLRSELLQRSLLARADDPHIIWRLCFESEQAYRASLLDPTWRKKAYPILQRSDLRVESLAYRRTRYGIAEPAIRNGIWRALIVSIIDGTSRARREQFEAETAAMPRYIKTIRNWAMSPIIESSGARNWSYIWEQDFADVEGLLGEYRMHPIHWGLVDRWYDVEHPDHIIDGHLLRTLCPSPEGAIAPVLATSSATSAP